MALITCPECSKEISDKVVSCPHCGFPLNKDTIETQKVEIASVNLKMEAKKKKKLFSIIVSIIIICGIIFSGYSVYSKEQAKKVSEEYATNIDLMMSEMLYSSREAESLINLTSDVWYNTIFEEYDSSTDKYTRKTGYWESDFNVSLKYLYEDNTTKTKVSNMKSASAKVTELIKKLQNPPEEYVRVYDTLLELHSSYQGLIDLAINPIGTLTTFNDSSNKNISKFVELYKKVETQLPNN